MLGKNSAPGFDALTKRRRWDGTRFGAARSMVGTRSCAFRAPPKTHEHFPAQLDEQLGRHAAFLGVSSLRSLRRPSAGFGSSRIIPRCQRALPLPLGGSFYQRRRPSRLHQRHQAAASELQHPINDRKRLYQNARTCSNEQPVWVGVTLSAPFYQTRESEFPDESAVAGSQRLQDQPVLHSSSVALLRVARNAPPEVTPFHWRHVAGIDRRRFFRISSPAQRTGRA
jgi:hypothetical protein